MSQIGNRTETEWHAVHTEGPGYLGQGAGSTLCSGGLAGQTREKAKLLAKACPMFNKPGFRHYVRRYVRSVMYYRVLKGKKAREEGKT